MVADQCLDYRFHVAGALEESNGDFIPGFEDDSIQFHILGWSEAVHCVEQLGCCFCMCLGMIPVHAHDM